MNIVAPQRLPFEGDRLTLTPSMRALNSLGGVLLDVLDDNGQLVLTDIAVGHFGPAQADLEFEACATVFGLACRVTARFHWVANALHSFTIIAIPQAAWSFSDLQNHLSVDLGDKARFLSHLSHAEGRIVVTSVPLNLDGVALAPGVSFTAASTIVDLGALADRLPVEHVPTGILTGRTCQMLAHLSRRWSKRFLTITLRYEITGLPGIESAKIRALEIALLAQTGPKITSKPAFHIGLSLVLNPHDPEITLIAALPETPSDPIVFIYKAKDPIALSAGVKALAHLLPASTDLGQVFGDRTPLPGLSAIMYCPGKWINLDLTLLDPVTGGAFRWNLYKDTFLEDAHLILSVSHSDTAQVQAGLNGTVEISNHRFRSEWYPDVALRGSLIDSVDFDPGTCLADLTGVELDLPAIDLSLTELSYECDLAFGLETYALGLAGHVDLLGNGAVVLDRLAFRVEKEHGTVILRTVDCALELAGHRIDLLGMRRDAAGWTFQGEAALDWTLPLSSLTQSLSDAWDAPIPLGMPDLELTSVGIRVETAQKSQHLWAIVDFEAPASLPWGGGKAEARIDVRTARPNPTAARQTDVSVAWSQTHADRVFEAEASFGHDGTTFILSWQGDDHHTLGLTELHDALSLGSVFDLPFKSDWSIFEFSSLSLAYTADPATITMAAVSALENDAGTLEIEADLASGARRFSIDWTSNAQGAPIGVETLFELFGFPVFFDPTGIVDLSIFDFESLSFRYEADGKPSLQFVGQPASDGMPGEIFVIAQRNGAEWTTILGAGFAPKHDGMEIALLQLARKYLSIEPTYLCLSSADVRRFTPPIPIPQPLDGTSMGGTLKSDAIYSRTPRKLSKGLTIAAKLDFASSNSSEMRRIGDIVGVTEIEGTLSIGPDTGTVSAILPGQVSIPTGTGNDLLLSDTSFGVCLAGDTPPGFFLSGAALFEVFGKTRRIEIRLTVAEEAAEASLHLENIPLPSPPPLPGVRFKDACWLEVGVQFEPAGVDIGFMGNFYIGDDPGKYTGEAVVVLEIIEDVPTPLYVRFSIDRLDLWAIFEAMTGVMHHLDRASDALELAYASPLENTAPAGEVAHLSGEALEFLKHQYKNLQVILDKIQFDDVAFHWAESIVILPDGSTAMPGVGFRGTLNLFGWKTFAAFECSVAAPTRFGGRLEMERIDLLGVVSIFGDGQGVLLRQAQGKADWETWKTSARSVEVANVSKPKKGGFAGRLDPVLPTKNAQYLIAPGGPVLLVSAQHAPFLHADIQLELFGLLHAEAKADIDEHGMDFSVNTSVGGISSLDLNCRVATTGAPHFEAHGKFAMHIDTVIHIDLPLIPSFDIPLSAGLDAEIDIKVTATDFVCSIEGSFEFEGIELHLPKLTINVPFSSFSALPDLVIRHILDNAGEIFEDLGDMLGDLAELAVQELKEVGEAIAHEAEAIAQGAVEAAQEVGKAAEAAFDAAEEGIEDAANALANAAEEVEGKAQHVIGDIAHEAEEVADELIKDGKKLLTDAGKAVLMVGKAIAVEVMKIEHAIEDVAKAVAHAVQQIAQAVAQEVQELLDTARQAAEQVVKAAEVIASGISDAAEAVWDEVGNVTDALSDIANKALHGIEDAGEAVGSAIKSVFSGW